MIGMNQKLNELNSNYESIKSKSNAENDDLYINSKSNDVESNDEYIKYFILQSNVNE